MNDFEDALRSELLYRADAADREVRLLEPVARRVRRARRRCTLAASSLAAIVGLGLTLTVPASSILEPAISVGPNTVLHGTLNAGMPTGAAVGSGSARGGVPAVGLAVTPPGWAPVAYLGAQISVPSGWLVESGGGSACGGGRGMVFLAQGPRPSVFKAMGCRLAANVVTLVDAGQSHAQPRFSGAAVYYTESQLRYGAANAPDYSADFTLNLGVKVAASGPLAGRVLATLTRSLRSVVLARGPRTPVPASWRWYDFGGIRFAAPASWAVERDAWWGAWSGGCLYGVTAKTVRLSTAAVLSAPGCGGLPLATAGLEAAAPGVVIGAGRYAAAEIASDATAASCLRLGGMRACVLQAGPRDDALLKVAVFPPRAARPTLVEIGLAGFGATARAIFDSIRPAP